MRWSGCTFFLFLISGTHAQFGEIASLATSLLGGALGNGAGLGALAGAGAAGAGAAGQAGGALAQIGQLYQLAQGALQLTGTGVGVLNQASEGNWFPAVLEQTAKNSQALMKQGGGLNLGALGPAPGKAGGGGAIGPEFGTSFPAPNIDDYDENAEIPGVTTDKKTPKAPDGLVDIEDGDYEIETTKPTTTTDAPTTTTTEEDEEETTTEPTTLPPRQIRIQLPDKNGKTEPEDDLDYEDLINKKKTDVKENLIPTIDAESTEELRKNVIATHGTKTQPIVPKLDKLVEVLQKSKLSKEEIDEIVAQVEGNKHIEKPAKYDFNAAVQNIPDKKNIIRQKITDASRIINTSFENQRKEQNIVIQKQVDELKVLPDLTESTVALSSTTTTTTPTNTTANKPITPPQPKHVQQTRSVQVVQQVAPPPSVQPLPQHPNPTPVQVPQPQPYNNYFYPQNQYQQQQVYYTQAPAYGQQTQNYWGQQNQFAPQASQYGVYRQQLPQPPQHPQQQYYQYVPQQPQQQYNQQYQYSTNIQTQTPVPHQQFQKVQQVQQPATTTVHNRPAPAQQVIYQQGNAQPTPSLPQQKPPAYSQPSGNTNQVVHYYHDGKQVVQQIIPKQIAATGNLPLNGPFKSQNAINTDPAEYQRRQRALQQAFNQPQARGPVATKTAPLSRQGSASVQPSSQVQSRIYESTVVATGHRQAHAIRTYQATKPTFPNPQPAAATRSSGRVSASKKRYSGHVLPGPTIDHRSLLEKRTTAKPRYVRVP